MLDSRGSGARPPGAAVFPYTQYCEASPKPAPPAATAASRSPLPAPRPSQGCSPTSTPPAVAAASRSLLPAPPPPEVGPPRPHCRPPQPPTRSPGASLAAMAPNARAVWSPPDLHKVEPLRRPSPDYFQKVQKYISPKMRAILVDWSVEVAEEFKLHAETLHLAVSFVDRFLTMNVITQDKLQLLGVTAMLVAAKYEETESPKMKVNRYTDITDNTYTKQQVVKMEADLLKSLSFEIGGPTVATFLRQFIASCRGGNSTSRGKLESMCSYLAELSLLDYDCISYLPSVVAAACLFVARFTIHPKARPWQQVFFYRSITSAVCLYSLYFSTSRCQTTSAVAEQFTILLLKAAGWNMALAAGRLELDWCWNLVLTIVYSLVLAVGICLVGWIIFYSFSKPRTWNYVVEQVCCKFVVGTCVCMMASGNCVITWDVNL